MHVRGICFVLLIAKVFCPQSFSHMREPTKPPAPSTTSFRDSVSFGAIAVDKGVTLSAEGMVTEKP